MLQPFNDASNSLGTQSDGGQGGNFFGTHSLPEVEPEDHTVALLVGPVHATLQLFIDLNQKDFEGYSFLAPVNLFPSLGSGDKTQEFFAIWEDADRDIPVFREAKAEYSKLN